LSSKPKLIIGAHAICSGGNLSFGADAASEFGRKRQPL
jgi:hypothetical protein